MRMTWRWAEKILHNWRDKEGATNRHMGGWGHCIVRTHPPRVGDPQTGGISQPQRSSPRREGFESYIWLPSPGVLHWEDEPPEYLALKTSMAYTWESWRVKGNRDSTFKGHIQNLTCSESQNRGSSLKGARVNPICWPWRASWRGKRQLRLPLGMETLAADSFGNSTAMTLVLASAILESSL